MSEQTDAQPQAELGNILKDRTDRAHEASVIAFEVPFDQAQDLKQRAEQALGVQLKDRGEAHLSILQFKREGHKVTADLTPEDLQILDTLTGQEIRIKGLGTIPQGTPEELNAYAQQEGNSVTVFLAVELPEEITEWMQGYAQRYNASEPEESKHLTYENPHITIGFTLRDRFDQEKVPNPSLNEAVAKFAAETTVTYGDLIGMFAVPTEGDRPKFEYQKI